MPRLQGMGREPWKGALSPDRVSKPKGQGGLRLGAPGWANRGRWCEQGPACRNWSWALCGTKQGLVYDKGPEVTSRLTGSRCHLQG